MDDPQYLVVSELPFFCAVIYEITVTNVVASQVSLLWEGEAILHSASS